MAIKKMDLFGGNDSSLNVVTLYHGSRNRDIVSTFGVGREDNDYGQGFYLTSDIDLAKEWAASSRYETRCWVHTFELNLSGLEIFDFEQEHVIVWLAELYRHRIPDNISVRAQKNIPMFIRKYAKDLSGYDVLKGWRADDSFFRIAQTYAEDDLDTSLVSKALHLGGWGIQYVCKSQKAFDLLTAVKEPTEVAYREWHAQFVNRDSTARQMFEELHRSNKNTLTICMSDLIRKR